MYRYYKMIQKVFMFYCPFKSVLVHVSLSSSSDCYSRISYSHPHRVDTRKGGMITDEHIVVLLDPPISFVSTQQLARQNVIGFVGIDGRAITHTSQSWSRENLSRDIFPAIVPPQLHRACKLGFVLLKYARNAIMSFMSCDCCIILVIFNPCPTPPPSPRVVKSVMV